MNFNATTALNQLTRCTNGLRRLCAMVGAHTFLDHGNAIGFKFKGCRRLGYCKITLNGDDTYTMLLGKIRKYELTNVQTIEGLYWDQLKEVFEGRTGLYLTL